MGEASGRSCAEAPVAVIGGGVVGCAVAHALARHGVPALVLEAEPELARGASGANSGILHTGFDSVPGELETELILRSASLREELGKELPVPVWRCGARLTANDEEGVAAVARLAENARGNGVAAELDGDGTLAVPGEALTDPVAYVHALAACARGGGSEVRLEARVVGLSHAGGALTVELAGGERLRARAAVNCAGLFADDVARLAGEAPVSIYPRKGEFLVFAAPPGPPLREILLPVPSALGKGVLVFPTLDGRVIAGPTARERTDRDDWSVEADAAELILARARRMLPALQRAEPIAAYAGLRPAGRDANYVIEHSARLPGLIHVAAIRSTGLSASLGIGEHVLGMLAAAGHIEPGPARALRAVHERYDAARKRAASAPWWQRAAMRGQPAGGPAGAR